MRRVYTGMATAIAAAAMAVTLAPAASAVTIIKIYPYTAQGAKQCHADLKLAPGGYSCTTIVVNGARKYALVRE